MQKKRKKTIYERFFKRFFDIILALFAIIILLPVFLIIFICSKIALKGKPTFCQYRPGRNGKVFKMYKFRSMTNEVDENGNLLPDEQRITKYGKFLRKTSLDELPQLFNILKGDMSFVGPRPRVVKDVIFFDKDVMETMLSVRPGLTGESQVAGGRSTDSWEKIFADEVSYASHITLWRDIKVLFKTVGAVFKSEGAIDGENTKQREYLYCNHLIKNTIISQQQFETGLAIAENIITNKGSVKFQPDLQPKHEQDTEKR